jgi:hypothetical protein
MSNVENRLKLNAEKQKRFREKQKAEGKKLVRGYLNKDALDCYEELREKTGWTDAELLSNSLRITFAAYKCGQIKLLNEWLKKNGK